MICITSMNSNDNLYQNHMYNQVSIMTCMYQVNTISHNTLWTVNYYLLCQRAPIATYNRHNPYYAYYTCQSGSYVIEIDRRDIVHTLGGSRTYLRPRPRRLALNQVVPLGTTVTIISLMNNGTVEQYQTRCQSFLGTLRWNRISARNLYLRSTQNTDAIFSFNFPNLGVSYLFTLLFNSIQYSYYLDYWNDTVTVTV